MFVECIVNIHWIIINYKAENAVLKIRYLDIPNSLVQGKKERWFWGSRRTKQHNTESLHLQCYTLCILKWYKKQEFKSPSSSSLEAAVINLSFLAMTIAAK